MDEGNRRRWRRGIGRMVLVIWTAVPAHFAWAMLSDGSPLAKVCPEGWPQRADICEIWWWPRSEAEMPPTAEDLRRQASELRHELSTLRGRPAPLGRRTAAEIRKRHGLERRLERRAESLEEQANQTDRGETGTSLNTSVRNTTALFPEYDAYRGDDGTLRPTRRFHVDHHLEYTQWLQQFAVWTVAVWSLYGAGIWIDAGFRKSE